MVCLVGGFPSSIAALQFEWAFQNPHLSRHIDADQRISLPVTRVKTNPKTGKSRRKPGRPSTSLLQRLANLHLLLRSPYFSQWPIEIRFLSQDVYHSWHSWCERVDEQLHPSISVLLDLPQQDAPADSEDITSGQRPSKRRKLDLIGKGGITGIDPTYVHMHDVLQKGRFILDADDKHYCALCARSLELDHELFTVCPAVDCRSVCHVRCISNHFLQSSPPGTVLPQTGMCPSCATDLHWLDLMKETSLRSRGQKEIDKVLSKRKKAAAVNAAGVVETDSEEDMEEDTVVAEHEVSDEDRDDAASMTSIESFSSMISKVVPLAHNGKSHVEIVIEDSEEDNDGA